MKRKIWMGFIFVMSIIGFTITGDPTQAVDRLGVISSIVTLASCASPLAGLVRPTAAINN